MARLALGLAGAALGSFTGIGANTGFLIGSTLGRILFPDPAVVTEGPRLGDLSISASTYGTAIPIAYGTLRMGGNLIWSSGLREVRTEEEIGGGKGSPPSQIQVTFTYFADIAYAFAEGPADDVLRIFFDNKLVFDKRGGTIINSGNLNFIFHGGDETQVADPTIAAAEGIANTPGHRGLVYIVFNSLNVTEFGNRVPQCTAEITFSSQSADSGRLATQNNPISTTHSTSQMAVDAKRRRIYMLGQSGDSIRVINMDTLTEIREVAEADILVEALQSTGEWVCDTDGFIYVNGGISNTRPIVKINPNTLTEVARFGFESIGGTPPDTFSAIDKAMVVELIDPIPDPLGGTGRRKFHISVSGVGDKLGIIDADDMTYIFQDPTINFTNVTGMVPVPVSLAPVAQGEGFFAQQNGGNNTLTVYKVTMESNASTLFNPLESNFGTSVVAVGTIPPSTWESDGSSFEVIGPMLDVADKGLIFIKDADSFVGVYVFKWTEADGIVWVTPVRTQAPVTEQTIATASIIQNGVFGWVNVAENASLIDTTDGSIISETIDTTNLTSPVSDNNGQQFFDGETQSVFSIQGNATNFLAQFFLGRVSGTGETLSSVITDLSSRVGLDVGDLDVSELTNDIVRGYAVTRQVTARSAIEPLAITFLFDGVESDDQIEFKKRGRDSVRTITEADMMVISRDTHDVIVETRIQEVELPERISIAYIDFDTDYQAGTQSVKRIKSPSPTMRSSNEQTIQIPVVLVASEAEQLAEKLLFTAWNERTSYSFQLPWEYLDLDPADVIDLSITRNSVTTNLRARLIKATANLDLTVSAEALNEDKITVESTAVADGASGFPQQVVPGPAFTQLFLFDIPLLRSLDDTGQSAARLYFGMDGFRDNWPGGVLFESFDGFVYSNTGLKGINPISHGIVTTLIPDTDKPWLTDDALSISVIMEEGTLSSVTDTQFRDNFNVALIGSDSTGLFEIVAFRDVVQEANGSFTLTRIMRGRKGTDAYTGIHAIGDRFFFLDLSTLTPFVEQLSQLNSVVFYKAVGFGATIESADTIPFTAVGKSLKPYAPVHLDSVVDGSDNIDLEWIRRDRIFGEGFQSSNNIIPNAEDTEEYEVDILDTPGGTVVRTFLALASPLVEYAKADIISDLAIGTGATTLSVAATDKFSRPSGDFVADGFVVGQTIETALFTAGANNGTFVVVAVQATLIEVDVNTLVVETGTGDETMDAIRENDLTFEVFQISAQVGRGFGAEETITL